MRIYAIADLHLSGNPPAKPMEVFGTNWLNHWSKIKTAWLEQVCIDDIVLLAGDISWAMKLNEALTDLNTIIRLPGKKILIRGNHDYWWQTVSKMTKAVAGQLSFLNNSFEPAGEWAICGSRGWTCPEDPLFCDTDLPIFQRELLRVESSLTQATKAGYGNIILMLHYPPFYGNKAKGGFTSLIEKYGVKKCVFGHLHGEAVSTAATGIINGVDYCLVSCDALNFGIQRVI
ncbi:MAG TPA: metallophosphoesterase [Methylomusa anaerophila]|uniref:Calcineurin-like phosphoesterase n=1 Tax=Methylomusa anaerophila TaxID=1930071 RepID=A0A348AF66_9FIRM|nr:metallophosphoesterase [Methylomusa anaerophila]BBB89714.1 calcineurin-like phosphoesterase [Methylomusa anaerophila]HML89241.1 metallophosphoesterase [Methylomusa anaerophila]